MNKRNFSSVLSLWACFVAVEAGAFVVCFGIMILDSGPLGSLEALAVRTIAQPIILPIALCSMPLGALLRMVLGLAFKQPRSVALISGAVVGLVGSVLFAFLTKDGWSAWFPIVSIGLFAGVVGGWAWWRVEKPFLDGQEISDTI
ncbi:hypothetical protein KX928_22950 [Roseobacter sp. YSTF-M11]|uniref:Uncharacterized protein n=1 Tax=Roseobacter insulae TaxID=2859783 RepID=A0A9X1FZV7_9RHOB|nr:hypothetical protein [Roseobacter insulae]MBW4710658.1 hypothetical protein [Roseobacter insulae]